MQGPKPGDAEPLSPHLASTAAVGARQGNDTAAPVAATEDEIENNSAATNSPINSHMYAGYSEDGVGEEASMKGSGSSSAAQVEAAVTGGGIYSASVNAGASAGGGEGGGGGGGGWSFARVTAMNGHFPSLKPTTVTASSITNATSAGDSGSGGRGVAVPAAAWGSSAAAAGGRSEGAWGTAKAEGGITNGGRRGEQQSARLGLGLGGMGSVGRGASPPAGEGEGAAGISTSSSGKKKGRKGKKGTKGTVSLFSNAGVRGK